MAAPLRFFFDYVSPYAYLAWTQIRAIAREHARALETVPVLFAGLLDAHGTRGPAEVPARRRYLIHDVVRLARHFGVAIDLPPAHPFRSLLALRVSTVASCEQHEQHEPRERRERLIDGLFAAAWVRRRDLADPRVVLDVVADAGLPRDIVDEAESGEAKQRLRAQTDDAVARGVFGVPTVLVDGELFFGCDSLPHLRRFLAGEERVPREIVERWESLPVGARRATADRG